MLHALIRDTGCRTLRVLDLQGRAEFNRSECLNVGTFFGQGDCLFMMDADIVLADAPWAFGALKRKLQSQAVHPAVRPL